MQIYQPLLGFLTELFPLERNPPPDVSDVDSLLSSQNAKQWLDAAVSGKGDAASADTLITPENLRARLLDFSHARLATDWRRGPPYSFPPEVDTARTEFFRRQGAFGERINHRVLSDADLKQAKVLFAFAPDDDFVRYDVVDGVKYRANMNDVLGSMTSLVNPASFELNSVSPPYAQEFIRAAIPPTRAHFDFQSPATLKEFADKVRADKPDVVLLSGLNVNTRVLLKMNLIARASGAQEVWLGNYAAMAPYKIIDEAFDRAIWTMDGGTYLREKLTDDPDFVPQHPEAKRMLADVNWLALDDDGQPVRLENFKTLHLSMRHGCAKNCSYCNFGRLAGGATQVDAADNIIKVIDDAHAMGIRRVYIIDPDFARPSTWSDDVEGRVLEHLKAKEMKWGCITSVEAMDARAAVFAEHGMKTVYLGIETLSSSHKDGKLKTMGRGWQDISDSARLAKQTSELDAMTQGLYMLGNPGESISEVMAGVDRLRDLGTHVPISQMTPAQPFPGTDQFAYAAKHGLIHDYDPDTIRYGKSGWQYFYGSHQISRPETPLSLTARARTLGESLGPLTRLGHRLTATLDPNLRRYRLPGWVPVDAPFNPLVMERVNVWGHHQINDLNRDGGFFDLLWQRRHPDTKRPPLAVDTPRSVTAAATLPLGLGALYAVKEAGVNGLIDAPWEIAYWALPHSIREVLPEEIHFIGAALGLALFNGGSALGALKVFSSMLIPIMLAGQVINEVAQYTHQKTFQAGQLGHGLSLAFGGTLFAKGLLGGLSMLPGVKVVAPFLLSAAGMVMGSDLLLGSLQTGSHLLGDVLDWEGYDIHAYQLRKKCWDQVMAEQGTSLALLRNYSQLMHQTGMASRFFGSDSVAQLEKAVQVKEQQLTSQALNKASQIMARAKKKAMVHGQLDSDIFRESVQQSLWEMETSPQLNTADLYRIAKITNEGAGELQLLTQAFTSHADWSEGVRNYHVSDHRAFATLLDRQHSKIGGHSVA